MAVPKGSGADGFLEGSGGFWRFWCRLLMRFWRVLVQIADEVVEGSGADGRQRSGRFRCR